MVPAACLLTASRNANLSRCPAGRVEQSAFPKLEGAQAPREADGLVSGFPTFFQQQSPYHK